MKMYYITGIPGSGKSELARKFKENNFHTIDIDYGFCKWINKPTKAINNWKPGKPVDFFDENEWICDFEKVFSKIDNTEGVCIVAGVADNQLEFLDKFEKVFLLRCDPRILFRRIDKRIDNIFGKGKEEKEMILSWYKDFERETLDKGAIPIDASASIDEVYNSISKYI